MKRGRVDRKAREALHAAFVPLHVDARRVQFVVDGMADLSEPPRDLTGPRAYSERFELPDSALGGGHAASHFPPLDR